MLLLLGKGYDEHWATGPYAGRRAGSGRTIILSSRTDMAPSRSWAAVVVTQFSTTLTAAASCGK